MTVSECYLEEGGRLLIAFSGPVGETDEEARALRALNFYTSFTRWTTEAEAQLAMFGGREFHHDMDGNRGSPQLSYCVSAQVDTVPTNKQIVTIKKQMDQLYHEILESVYQ
jgi:hypothetical protein